MSPAHTPGPWRVKQTGFTYFRDLTILGEDWHGEETPIAAALVRNALHPYGRADKARSEIEANARLIAAAPTMFDYLTMLAFRGDNEAHEIISKITGP